MAQLLGIDVGGTGIKAAIADARDGRLLTEVRRVATPDPATPANVARAIGELVARFDYTGTIACSFPTVVVGGLARTAGNLHPAWRGVRIDRIFRSVTKMPFIVCNDADAAGLAEMTLGAGRRLRGLVITITIGTGLGSGVFYDGRLIPNIELGRMPGKDGQPIEFYAGNRARVVNRLSWNAWARRFDYFLKRAARVMAPDHFIIGGGISTELHRYRHLLEVDVPLRVARFRNRAGIVGAVINAQRSLAGATRR